MNRKIIFEEIKRLAETIYEQTEAITNYSTAIPVIEIDIVLDNVRKLYQSYKTLEDCTSKTNITSENITLAENIVDNISTSEVAVTPEVELSQVKEPINVIVDNEIQSLPEQIVNKTIEIENVVESDSKLNELIVEKDNISDVPDLFANVVPEISKNSQDANRKKAKPAQAQGLDLFAENNNKPIVADKFKDEKKSLNDIIAGNNQNNSIGSKMQQSPIADLRTAIRINEKFLFINNLFDGNMQEYNTFIDALNEKKNINEANEFVDLNKEKLEWEDNNESFLMLKNLVSRRFF